MTRYTNVALKKRTYVEAGFNYREPEEESNEAGPSNSNDHEEVTNTGSTVQEGDAPAAAPKRKRSRKKAKKSVEGGGGENTAEGAGTAGKEASADGAEGDTTEEKGSVKVKSASQVAQGKKKLMRLKQKLGKGKNTGKEARHSASEQRRLRRIDERNADTTCFACREKGHAARDCPKAIASDALEGEGGRRKLGKQTVGICYRCGSRRHNLSRCREAVDPENPLPFSSCFVCSKQGHLASQCPENRSKGVYPNGGCCKLCQETTHLAKDCPMRKPEVIATTTLVGTGAEAGADEDDFHTFRRKNLELTKEEKAEERLKKQQALKVGAHSGVVKAFGRPIQKSQKIVTF